MQHNLSFFGYKFKFPIQTFSRLYSRVARSTLVMGVSWDSRKVVVNFNYHKRFQRVFHKTWNFKVCLSGFFNSCRRLPETKRHSSLSALIWF